MLTKLCVDQKAGLSGQDFPERTKAFGSNHRDDVQAKTFCAIFCEQIDDFKANGHLILSGFVPDETVAEWQQQFWSHLGCTIDEPEKWPDKVEGFKPDPRPSA